MDLHILNIQTHQSSIVMKQAKKKPSNARLNGFRYKGWLGLVVEHHRHDQHRHCFTVFKSIDGC